MVGAAEGTGHEAARAVEKAILRAGLTRRGGYLCHAAEGPFLDFERGCRNLEGIRVNPCGVGQIEAHADSLGNVEWGRTGGGEEEPFWRRASSCPPGPLLSTSEDVYVYRIPVRRFPR